MSQPIYQLLPPYHLDAVEDVTLDFKNYPEILAGQVIASAKFVFAPASPTDLVTTPAAAGPLAVSTDGKQVQFTKGAGGTPGVEYLLEVKATTNAGKVLVGNFKLALVQ